VLDRALAEHRLPVILAAVQTLGDLGEVRAAQPVGQRQPALLRALNYPDRRVQFAAAEALLRISNDNPQRYGWRIVDVLRRALVPDVSQNQDGRFPADAFGVAVHETVEDEVAGDHEAAARKRVDQGLEALPRNLERHSRGL
jgi:HEAT repeat protein